MDINQRDVYLLKPPFNDLLEEHPFIILSIKEANAYESTFIAVMITSSKIYKDEYSFELNNGMFESPLKKQNSYVRMHLLTLCLHNEVIGKRLNKMKEFYFRELMASIGDLIFNYSFNPAKL